MEEAREGEPMNPHHAPYSCKIIADSLSPGGIRLTTLTITYPRFILPQMLTHRMFSRNTESSRAIPISKRIQRVIDQPAFPLQFGRNQRGMVAGEEVDKGGEALRIWLEARDQAVEQARKMARLGVHKQVVNRLLEPFVFVTQLITATEWENFLALRLPHDAQPEIQRVARSIRHALTTSTPIRRSDSWHLPFLTEEEHAQASSPGWAPEMGTWFPTEGQMISAARCARVSYLTHEGTRDIQKDLDLAHRLLSAGHMSPFEHQALPRSDTEFRSSNFRGWTQFRKMIPGEAVFHGGNNYA